MTSATKRKHVVKEMLENFDVPSENQQIVKVIGNPGSNLHEIITRTGVKMLCSLPLKFRQNIWIKRGDFVVVEPITEGDKVKAEIVRILLPQHVKSLKKEGQWPSEFRLPSEASSVVQAEAAMKSVSLQEKSHHKECYIINPADQSDEKSGNETWYSSDEDDLSDIPPNTNRPSYYVESSSSESECESDW